MKKIPKKLHKQIQRKVFRQRYGVSLVLHIRDQRKFYKCVKSLVKYMPNLSLCNDIVGIQPMDGPVGKVYNLNIYKGCRVAPN